MWASRDGGRQATKGRSKNKPEQPPGEHQRNGKNLGQCKPVASGNERNWSKRSHGLLQRRQRSEGKKKKAREANDRRRDAEEDVHVGEEAMRGRAPPTINVDDGCACPVEPPGAPVSGRLGLVIGRCASATPGWPALRGRRLRPVGRPSTLVRATGCSATPPDTRGTQLWWAGLACAKARMEGQATKGTGSPVPRLKPSWERGLRLPRIGPLGPPSESS
ncbi:hypothetical protein GQ53DRAFT_161542 [Thozetella sp. PMI_491]|nr:hypothetical protein GQ53DRAFT_161542 [Thozetella sp. PMI_491]